MSPVTTLRPILVTSEWNADANKAASVAFRVASRVSDTVQSQLGILALAKDVWQLDGMIASVLKKIYTSIDSNLKNPPSNAEAASDEEVRSFLATLRIICTKNEETYKLARANGLTNRRFIGTALNSVQVRVDELLDLVESIEISMDRPDLDAVFSNALSELESGHTVRMTDL